jgi:outer membrane protein
MKAWHYPLTALAIVLVLAGVAAAQQAPPRPAPGPGSPAAASPASAPAFGRLGFVDVQRVLARSAAGVSAREQLERERAVMQKEMDGRRQELEKLREELEKKGPLLTAETRREKQDAFERKRRDATRLADDLQKELEKKEQTLLQRVLQDVSFIIERVAKDKGYAMIVERRGLLYASAEVDLTDEIIRVYDQESGPKGKK